jgi:hypothetical protein
MLQGACPTLPTTQYTNWQIMLEHTRRRNLWGVQHVVGFLQTEQSSLTTVCIRFPQNVSYKPL